MPDRAQAADLTSRAVLDILADGGDGTLPSLTREELWALSDEPVLAHGGDTAWWAAVDEAGRELVLQTAQRGLVARNLLTAAPGGEGLVLDPRVAVVLRARREPSWLAVLGDPAGGDVRLELHGIDLQRHHTDAALVSARLEGIHLNRLVPGEQAPRVMADWLLRPASEEQDAETVGRTVELIAPREPGTAGSVRGVRAIVLGSAGSWVLSQIDDTTDAPGEPLATDARALAAWIREQLAPHRS